MRKRYLEQRHIVLDSGRSCLALEREYWQALEVLVYEDEGKYTLFPFVFAVSSRI